MAEGKGRANFGPPGPAGAAKKNGWARARPGLEKERLGRGQGQARARAAEKERHHCDHATRHHMLTVCKNVIILRYK